jgi:hypothetical protein
MSSMHQIFGTNYATEGMSTCEYSLDTSFSEEGLMFGPGLECEHHIIISVASYALDANYEYIWSDWTYYVHWSTTPVVMH